MKKFFSIVLLSVLFSSVSFAQNAYVGASYGFDMNVDKGKNTNLALNLQVGYFMDNCQALEIEYTHGFQKDFIYYNRIGANYVYEFEIADVMAAPYFKLGAAYKNYGYDFKNISFNEGFCDVKAAIGFKYYAAYNVAIDLGLNFTNSFNDDVDWCWRNTIAQLSIGLSYYF